MRLTGITIFTPPVARTAGASAENIAAPVAGKSAPGNEGVGVATRVEGTEQSVPVNADRVAQIRKAIQEDRYPLVPAEIADALIAAKLYGTIAA